MIFFGFQVKKQNLQNKTKQNKVWFQNPQDMMKQRISKRKPYNKASKQNGKLLAQTKNPT